MYMMIAVAIASADTTCSRDFEVVTATVSQDYAGFETKRRARSEDLARLTEGVRSKAELATDSEMCTAALKSWVEFFKDGHLSLSSTSPAPPSTAPRRNNTPTLEFRTDSSAVLRLPSFGARWKGPIDTLMLSNRDQLAATPYLIVDVRGNGGGGNTSYENVTPLLYTDSLLIDEFEAWSSPGNIDGLRQLMTSGVLPPHVTKDMAKIVAALEQHPGQFVKLGAPKYRVDSMREFPRRVAVLIDRACVSACELFVIDALASRKTIIVGSTGTGGVVDYGNLRPLALPSGLRRMSIPTARSIRLPRRAFDNVGVLPDVVAPGGETDLVTFARAQLGKQKLPRGRQ